ncbi:ADP-ribosylation factor 6-like [Entamoeba marina]
MGNVIKKLFGSKNVRVLMLGLDASGKTTICNKFAGKDDSLTIPTMGHHTETIKINKLKLTVWEVGGQEKIRQHWDRYFEGSSALIFVIDCSDRTRADLARTALEDILLSEEMLNVTLLVLANKNDVNGAMLPSEIVNVLRLNELKIKWHVQTSCALNGDGLEDGLTWLARNLD